MSNRAITLIYRSINNSVNLSMLKKKCVQIATAHTDKEVFIAEICFYIYYSILNF